MIGHIEFSTSVSNTLGYCLEDKKVTLRQGQQEAAYKDRAEVLYYNQCFGNQQELIRQFEEVQKLNRNIAKPFLHLALSMAPEDAASKSLFVELSRDCARALDFENHQYVTILHKDTDNAHVHIVANRVGFDQHTVVNQYMLRNMNSFCREAEEQYHLTQTPAMRWYRSQEERQAPSQDQRVIRLGEVIGQTLQTVVSYDEFKKRLDEEGYRLYKTERGIAFKDADRVVIRGYETGYPWKRIEKTLQENEERRQELVQKQEEARQELVRKAEEHRQRQGRRLGHHL